MKTMLEILLEKRAALRAELDAMVSEDRDMTPEEVAKFDAGLADMADLDTRIDSARALEERNKQVDAITPVPAPVHEPRAVVTREERTYHAGNDPRGSRFLADVAARMTGDFNAGQRLARHSQEEVVEYREKGIQLRDVGTSAFDGLTVPQYLTGLYANTARAGRPLADNARRLDLPADGMTVNIARVTTGVTAAIQATQNATVSETDIDDTNLVVDVRTIAGSQDVALQAIQRSTGAEAVVLEDLIMAYHTELDNQLINGSGASGQHRGIRNVSGISPVTYTDSTPTGLEGYGPLWAIQAAIEAAVYRRATHFVMHPRRFNWFASTVSTSQALVGFNGASALQFGSTNDAPYGAGVRGFLAGLPVIVDANIPTNISSDQDTILAVNANELFLWEQPGSPLYIRAEQPLVQNLAVRMVVFGFSAFTAGRYPAAHGAITGTGLGGTLTYGIAAS